MNNQGTMGNHTSRTPQGSDASAAAAMGSSRSPSTAATAANPSSLSAIHRMFTLHTPAPSTSLPPLPPIVGEEERLALVEAIVAEFGCSRECATSCVESGLPDADRCRALVRERQQHAFVIIVGFVSKQREYVEKLCADIRVAFQHFPLLNSLDDKSEEMAALAATGGGPSPDTTIDWAAVRAALFTPEKPLLFYMNTDLANVGVPDDLLVLERAYSTLVKAKGCSHVVGCYASGDGVVVAMDYVNERICGRSVQELAQAIQFPPEVVAAVDDLERTTPTVARAYVNVFGNDPATSHTKRQDKGSAQAALRDAGLAYIRSFVTTQAAAALEKIRDGSLLLPVVVKPSTGAGSEFVTLCYTEDDVAVAFAMVEGLRTSQGTDAAVLVVEEYIEGPEYVVNTVSHNGVAVVTDVWQSWKYPKAVYTTGMSAAVEVSLRLSSGDNNRKRHKTSILYDKQTLIPNLASLPPEHEARRVTEYTLRCLDALELRNGCAHCELRVDTRPVAAQRRRAEGAADGAGAESSPSAEAEAIGEPVLIELNPRMQGDAPRSTDVVGYDQFSLLLYIGEAANTFGGATAASSRKPFSVSGATPARGEIPWPPVPRLYHGIDPASTVCTTVLFLVASCDGILNGAALPSLTSLPSFERFTRHIFKANAPGFVTPVRNTVDLFSSPAACVMRGSAEQVAADCEAIRAMEAATLTGPFLSRLQSAGQQKSAVQALRRRLEVRRREHKKAAAEVARMAATVDGAGAEGGEAALVAEYADLLRRNQEYEEAEWRAMEEELGSEQAKLKEARQALAADFIALSPPPLYVPHDVFELLKTVEIGYLLSVQ